MNSYGRTAYDYVYGMLNDSHINGKKIKEYGIFEFMKLPDIEVLNFSRSYEGESTLTNDIQSRLKGIGREDLISHGFELAFKRVR